MKKQAKTLQIFLPSGEPQGIREAHITTAIMRVIEVPRTAQHLTEFWNMPEAKSASVYFLIEEETDALKPKIYIGQSSDVKARFTEHLQKKSFWQKAMIASSRTDNLTPAHMLQLERLCIQRAKEVGRFAVDNVNDGQAHALTKQLLAECEDIFDTTSLLLATLGLDLFSKATSEEAPVYRCSQAGTDALAQYSPSGMTVLKGSKARVEATSSFQGRPLFQTRQALIGDGVLKQEGAHMVFTEDHTFGSPSTAASITVCHGVNGWEVWKTEDGKTLDDVIRKAVASENPAST